MNKWQKDVLKFIKSSGGQVPDLIGFNELELSLSLIKEESTELIEAIEEKNLVEAIDGACDTIYVILWAMNKWGIDLGPFWDEVQRTNMAKIVNGQFYKNSEGKITKPPGWKPPKITQMLLNQIEDRGGGGKLEKSKFREVLDFIKKLLKIS